MRTIELTRNEGEWLVDLLEDCPSSVTWRHELATTIRQKFGMCTAEQSASYEAELAKQRAVPQ